MSQRLWTCNGCGAVGTWTEAWSYYGNIEGDKIDFVACSPACMAKFAPPKRKRGKRTDPLDEAADALRSAAKVMATNLEHAADEVRAADFDAARSTLDLVDGMLEELRERVRGLYR